MEFSFWEKEIWLQSVDFIIIGSGIVGLTCAIELRKKHPKAKIVVIEKGMLPQGASTKNAGFACFGSLSELAVDLEQLGEDKMLELVNMRWHGLKLLRDELGDSQINFQQFGGYELFQTKQEFDRISSFKDQLNRILRPIFKKSVFESQETQFPFQSIYSTCIFNSFEGQLDTGKMMIALIQKAQEQSILILNNVTVVQIEDQSESVKLRTNQFELKAKACFVATNGFANQLLNLSLKPARAQVLITKPIKNLPFKGTFHMEEGYYYFRNVGDRVLIGGARNLAIEEETTTNFGTTSIIKNELENRLKTIVLPNSSFEIDMRWSGIMGVGNERLPIVNQISKNVFCGVRLSGMGIAIGSLIGKQLAQHLR